MSGRVAVVIPACNAELTIRATLDSLLAQTNGDFEAIVVDDGSTDSTPLIAREYAARDKRLRVLSQLNAGPALARMAGIEHTDAPLIAGLDADDIWHPSFLEKLCKALDDAGPGTVLAYTNARVIDMQNCVMENAPSYEFCGRVFHQMLLLNFIGNGSAMVFRRAPAVKAGGYGKRYFSEDWLLGLRLAAQGEFAVVREYLVGYRATPGALSTKTLAMRRSRVATLNEVFAEYDGIDERIRNWALGLVHCKCFLHELRGSQLRAAARSLITALRADVPGSLSLLFAAGRWDWLRARLFPVDRNDSATPFSAYMPDARQAPRRTRRLELAGNIDRHGDAVPAPNSRAP